MLFPHIFALTLALAPSLASAAIFPKDSHVKMLDAKGFKRAMKKNETSVVAFVAPWCGHCQRMVPEYSKAALSLHPLVPLYAVDCDAESNKRLCGEQGVQGFPTVKLFPRGNQKPAIPYDSPTRTASAFFYWASRLVPDNVKKLSEWEDITKWASKGTSKPRALLLNKDKKSPLLWQVLSNKYGPEIQFGSHHDPKGKTAKSMGLTAGTKKKTSKVVIYPVDSTIPVLYHGLNKFEALSKFFSSVLDGTTDLKVVSEEETIPSEEDVKIQQKQESQNIPLAPAGEPDIDSTKDGVAPQRTPSSKEKVISEPEEVIAIKTEEEQVIVEAVPETVPTETSAAIEPEETKSTATAFPSAKPENGIKSEEAGHPTDEL